MRISGVLLATITAVGFLGVAMGCRNSRPATASAAPDLPMADSIRYYQGGCFGNCPVFDLSVSASGSARYDGKQYSPYRGLHLGAVAKQQLAQLQRYAGEVLGKADDLPKRIESGIADASSRRVMLYQDGVPTEFSGDIEFAPPVDSLLDALMVIATETKWAPAPGTPPLPPNRLRVTLAEDVKLEELVGEFWRQQLNVVDSLPALPQTYIVSFDPYTMTLEEMLRDMPTYDIVESVLAEPQDVPVEK